jgi:hypothetical protein
LADREVTVTTGVGASESEEVPMLTLMAKCGITVAQDETFFVEPKSEETA